MNVLLANADEYKVYQERSRTSGFESSVRSVRLSARILTTFFFFMDIKYQIVSKQTVQNMRQRKSEIINSN